MSDNIVRLFLLGLCLAAGLVQPGLARQRVSLGTTAYLDYYYILNAPDEALEGENGFTYRRLYLTTDYRISDAFFARARLEAGDETTGSRGPVPFVKDLYLRWTSDAGHRLTFGVMPPPAFTVSEEVWDYRSLEKTIMDLNDIVSSRDMGVKAEGPLLPEERLGYAVMIANNNAERPENNRHKRLYGQLQSRPAKRFRLTAGADYAAYPAPRSHAWTVNGFAGYEGEVLRAGVEAYWHRIDFRSADADEQAGVSLFASARLSEPLEVVGRFDRVALDLTDDATFRNFFLVGFTYQPHRSVRFIPNLYTTRFEPEDETFINGRVTLEISIP